MHKYSYTQHLLFTLQGKEVAYRIGQLKFQCSEVLFQHGLYSEKALPPISWFYYDNRNIFTAY